MLISPGIGNMSIAVRLPTLRRSLLPPSSGPKKVLEREGAGIKLLRSIRTYVPVETRYIPEVLSIMAVNTSQLN